MPISKNTITFLVLVILISSANCFAEGCNEAQAYNKMMAIGRADSRLMNSKEPGSLQKGAQIGMASAKISAVIAQKKYDEACRQFDALAKEAGIDLKKESVGLITFEELSKDGGKRGGVCSQADAQIKMMGMHKQIQDQVALGDVDQDVFRKFMDDTGKLSDLFFTNPSEMCKKLDELKGKYHVS